MGKKVFRDEVAWWIITRTLRHIATESWATQFREKHRMVSEGATLNPQDKAWRDQYPIDATLAAKCAFCDKKFRQTLSASKPYPGVYCCVSHKTKHKTQLKAFRERPQTCPFDGKAAYSTGESAIKHLNTLKAQNPGMALNRVYGCRCGKYHIGRWKYEVVSE